MERTAVLIDGAYLDKVLTGAFQQARIDFEKLVSHTTKNKKLLRAYYYHCPPYMSQEPTEEEKARYANKQRFFTALSNIPQFQVQLGKLVYRGQDRSGNPIFVQKLVDVMLSVEMVQLAATRQISHVVLVGGDNDFIPAVKAAKQLGILVSLYHGPPIDGYPTVNNQLWGICDERSEISQDLVDSILR
jgi:uncharacterized LabA/DUF88 family protein